MAESNTEKYAEKIVKQLAQRKLSVATAESCTGGLLAKYITDISGASAVFSCGAVTYSNEMKTKMLGVDEAVLNQCGAVSSEVALKMAQGVREYAKSDLGISVTGIAGPESDDSGNPVGLCFIGLSDKNDNYVIKLNSEQNRKLSRSEIRENTAYHAFLLLQCYLDNYMSDFSTDNYYQTVL